MAVRVVLNPAGMREMLASKEVERDLLRRGKQVAATAEAIGHQPHEGDVNYYAESSRGTTRARCVVVADHPGALGQEEAYRTLGTAIDAARLQVTSYPDAEELLIGYLKPIVGVPVRTRVPRDRPDKWVQVRRSGGIDDVARDRPRIDVFAWGGDEDDAHDLCMTTRSAIHALAGTTLLGPACYGVEEFLGPTRSDDRESGAPRMWMTVQLSLRTTGQTRAPI